MNKVFLASAVAAALAAGASVVSAQSAQAVDEARARLAATPAASADEASAAPRARGERRVKKSAAERVEARLAHARAALKITDAQQPQWDNFANVLRKHASEMDQRMQQRHAQRASAASAQEGPKLTAIARMERAQQRLAERSARLDEVVGAAKPLYASLSAEQRQVADSMLARHGARGKHHGHHGRGMKHSA